MKKHIAIILLLTFSFQASASPYASNMTAAAQTKAIQACFDGIITQVLNPENLNELLAAKGAKGKYLDRLEASKALMIWSLGHQLERHIDQIKTDQKELFFSYLGLSLGAGILALASYVRHFETNKYIRDTKFFSAEELTRRQRTVQIYSWVTVGLLAITVVLSKFTYDTFNEYGQGFIADIMDTETNDDFYNAIADDESEHAYQIRSTVIAGCNLIRNEIKDYVDHPDKFLLDLTISRRDFSSGPLLVNTPANQARIDSLAEAEKIRLEDEKLRSSIRIPSLENAEVATREDTSTSSIPVKSNDGTSSSTPTSAPITNTKPAFINVADNGTPVTTCDQLFLKGVYKKASIDGKEADIYMKFESQFGSKKAYAVITNSKADFSDTKSAKKFNASLGQVYEQSTGINHCALTEYPDIGVTTTYLVLKVNKDGSFVLGNNLRHTAAKYNVKKISE